MRSCPCLRDALLPPSLHAVLRAAPGDVDALACKAVACLQQGEYEAATSVLAHQALAGTMTFERAYCCYRTGKFQQVSSSQSIRHRNQHRERDLFNMQTASVVEKLTCAAGAGAAAATTVQLSCSTSSSSQ